jgi:hypothetical protein
MAASHDTAATNPGHGVEVGMEFEDKGDDVAERRDRTPPPTQTYKPTNKGKQASAQ